MVITIGCSTTFPIPGHSSTICYTRWDSTVLCNIYRGLLPGTLEARDFLGMKLGIDNLIPVLLKMWIFSLDFRKCSSWSCSQIVCLTQRRHTTRQRWTRFEYISCWICADTCQPFNKSWSVVLQYGVPLDDRADFTKTDWLMWVAAMGNKEQVKHHLEWIRDHQYSNLSFSRPSWCHAWL